MKKPLIRTNMSRKTKILLASAPMFLVPLALLAFSIYTGMGFYKSSETMQQGLITELPGPLVQKSAVPQKWESYQMEAPKIFEEIVPLGIVPEDREQDFVLEEFQMPSGQHTSQKAALDQEKLLESRLAALTALESSLHSDPVAKTPDKEMGLPVPDQRRGEQQELDKLEQLMGKLAQRQFSPDPELQQLEVLLDKIMAIQYPQLMEENMGIENFSAEAPVFEVRLQQSEVQAPVLNEEENGFFGLQEAQLRDFPIQPAIPAVIDEDKKVASGNTVRMKLTAAVGINGVQVPAGTAVSGTCQLDGERLRMEHILMENHLLPVRLEAFGTDAVAGIQIPGSVGRETAQQGMERSMMRFNTVPVGMNLETQLAASGMDTARSFLGKKSREKKVMVKQGHPVLLMDRS